MNEAKRVTLEFIRNWQATWSRFGDAAEGFAEFRRLIDHYIGQMRRVSGQLVLRNGLPFLKTATILVLNAALADGSNSPEGGELRPAMPGPRSAATRQHRVRSPSVHHLSAALGFHAAVRNAGTCAERLHDRH